MNTTNPNDSVYPVVLTPQDYANGISKREYFAGLALQGLCSNDRLLISPALSIRAVEMADALIKQLNSSNNEEAK